MSDIGVVIPVEAQVGDSERKIDRLAAKLDRLDDKVVIKTDAAKAEKEVTQFKRTLSALRSKPILFNTNLKKVSAAARTTSAEFKGATSNAQSLAAVRYDRPAKSLHELNRNVNNLSSGFSRATRLVRNFIIASTGIISVTAGVTKLTRSSDMMIDSFNKMALVTGPDAAADTLERLYQLSDKTNNSIRNATQIFNRFGLALGDSTDAYELEKVSETVLKAMKISGADSASGAAAIFQLSQGIAAAQLRGQELNSVLEQAPRIAKIFADELGVPIGALRKIAEEGKLTTDFMMRAFQNQAYTINKEYDVLSTTIGGRFKVMTEHVQRFFGAFTNRTGISLAVITMLDRIGAKFKEWEGGIGNVKFFKQDTTVEVDVKPKTGIKAFADKWVQEGARHKDTLVEYVLGAEDMRTSFEKFTMTVSKTVIVLRMLGQIFSAIITKTIKGLALINTKWLRWTDKLSAFGSGLKRTWDIGFFEPITRLGRQARLGDLYKIPLLLDKMFDTKDIENFNKIANEIVGIFAGPTQGITFWPEKLRKGIAWLSKEYQSLAWMISSKTIFERMFGTHQINRGLGQILQFAKHALITLRDSFIYAFRHEISSILGLLVLFQTHITKILSKITKAFLQITGLDIVFKKISSAVSAVYKGAKVIIEFIVNTIRVVVSGINKAITAIESLGGVVGRIASNIKTATVKVYNSIRDLVKDIVNVLSFDISLGNIFSSIAADPSVILREFTKIKKSIYNLIQDSIDYMKKLTDRMKSMMSALKNNFRGIFDGIIKPGKATFSLFYNKIVQFVDKIRLYFRSIFKGSNIFGDMSLHGIMRAETLIQKIVQRSVILVSNMIISIKLAVIELQRLFDSLFRRQTISVDSLFKHLTYKITMFTARIRSIFSGVKSSSILGDMSLHGILRSETLIQKIVKRSIISISNFVTSVQLSIIYIRRSFSGFFQEISQASASTFGYYEYRIKTFASKVRVFLGGGGGNLVKDSSIFGDMSLHGIIKAETVIQKIVKKSIFFIANLVTSAQLSIIHLRRGFNELFSSMTQSIDATFSYYQYKIKMFADKTRSWLTGASRTKGSSMFGDLGLLKRKLQAESKFKENLKDFLQVDSITASLQSLVNRVHKFAAQFSILESAAKAWDRALDDLQPTINKLKDTYKKFITFMNKPVVIVIPEGLIELIMRTQQGLNKLRGAFMNTQSITDIWWAKIIKFSPKIAKLNKEYLKFSYALNKPIVINIPDTAIRVFKTIKEACVDAKEAVTDFISQFKTFGHVITYIKLQSSKTFMYIEDAVDDLYLKLRVEYYKLLDMLYSSGFRLQFADRGMSAALRIIESIIGRVTLAVKSLDGALANLFRMSPHSQSFVGYFKELSKAIANTVAIRVDNILPQGTVDAVKSRILDMRIKMQMPTRASSSSVFGKFGEDKEVYVDLLSVDGLEASLGRVKQFFQETRQEFENFGGSMFEYAISKFQGAIDRIGSIFASMKDKLSFKSEIQKGSPADTINKIKQTDIGYKITPDIPAFEKTTKELQKLLNRDYNKVTKGVSKSVYDEGKTYFTKLADDLTILFAFVFSQSVGFILDQFNYEQTAKQVRAGFLKSFILPLYNESERARKVIFTLGKTIGSVVKSTIEQLPALFTSINSLLRDFSKGITDNFGPLGWVIQQVFNVFPLLAIPMITATFYLLTFNISGALKQIKNLKKVWEWAFVSMGKKSKIGFFAKGHPIIGGLIMLLGTLSIAVSDASNAWDGFTLLLVGAATVFSGQIITFVRGITTIQGWTRAKRQATVAIGRNYQAIQRSSVAWRGWRANVQPAAALMRATGNQIGLLTKRITASVWAARAWKVAWGAALAGGLMFAMSSIAVAGPMDTVLDGVSETGSAVESIWSNSMDVILGMTAETFSILIPFAMLAVPWKTVITKVAAKIAPYALMLRAALITPLGLITTAILAFTYGAYTIWNDYRMKKKNLLNRMHTDGVYYTQKMQQLKKNLDDTFTDETLALLKGDPLMRNINFAGQLDIIKSADLQGISEAQMSALLSDTDNLIDSVKDVEAQIKEDGKANRFTTYKLRDALTDAVRGAREADADTSVDVPTTAVGFLTDIGKLMYEQGRVFDNPSGSVEFIYDQTGVGVQEPSWFQRTFSSFDEPKFTTMRPRHHMEQLGADIWNYLGMGAPATALNELIYGNAYNNMGDSTVLTFGTFSRVLEDAFLPWWPSWLGGADAEHKAVMAERQQDLYNRTFGPDTNIQEAIAAGDYTKADELISWIRNSRQDDLEMQGLADALELTVKQGKLSDGILFGPETLQAGVLKKIDRATDTNRFFNVFPDDKLRQFMETPQDRLVKYDRGGNWEALGEQLSRQYEDFNLDEWNKNFDLLRNPPQLDYLGQPIPPPEPEDPFDPAVHMRGSSRWPWRLFTGEEPSDRPRLTPAQLQMEYQAGAPAYSGMGGVGFTQDDRPPGIGMDAGFDDVPSVNLRRRSGPFDREAMAMYDEYITPEVNTRLSEAGQAIHDQLTGVFGRSPEVMSEIAKMHNRATAEIDSRNQFASTLYDGFDELIGKKPEEALLRTLSQREQGLMSGVLDHAKGRAEELVDFVNIQKDYRLPDGSNMFELGADGKLLRFDEFHGAFGIADELERLEFGQLFRLVEGSLTGKVDLNQSVLADVQGKLGAVDIQHQLRSFEREDYDKLMDLRDEAFDIRIQLQTELGAEERKELMKQLADVEFRIIAIDASQLHRVLAQAELLGIDIPLKPAWREEDLTDIENRLANLQGMQGQEGTLDYNRQWVKATQAATSYKDKLSEIASFSDIVDVNDFINNNANMQPLRNMHDEILSVRKTIDDLRNKENLTPIEIARFNFNVQHLEHLEEQMGEMAEEAGKHYMKRFSRALQETGIDFKLTDFIFSTPEQVARINELRDQLKTAQDNFSDAKTHEDLNKYAQAVFTTKTEIEQFKISMIDSFKEMREATGGLTVDWAHLTENATRPQVLEMQRLVQAYKTAELNLANLGEVASDSAIWQEANNAFIRAGEDIIAHARTIGEHFMRSLQRGIESTGINMSLGDYLKMDEQTFDQIRLLGNNLAEARAKFEAAESIEELRMFTAELIRAENASEQFNIGMIDTFDEIKEKLGDLHSSEGREGPAFEIEWDNYVAPSGETLEELGELTRLLAAAELQYKNTQESFAAPLLASSQAEMIAHYRQAILDLIKTLEQSVPFSKRFMDTISAAGGSINMEQILRVPKNVLESLHLSAERVKTLREEFLKLKSVEAMKKVAKDIIAAEKEFDENMRKLTSGMEKLQTVANSVGIDMEEVFKYGTQEIVDELITLEEQLYNVRVAQDEAVSEGQLERWRQLQVEAERTEKKMRDLANLTPFWWKWFEGMEGVFHDAVYNIITGTTSLLEGLKDLFDNVVKHIVRRMSEDIGNTIYDLTKQALGIGQGSGSGGDGGFIGKAVGFIGGLFGFKDGGMVYGAGGPTGDEIPAWLSSGEYVINAKSTRKFRPLLDKINTYARGGVVGVHSAAAESVNTTAGVKQVDEEALGERQLKVANKSYGVLGDISGNTYDIGNTLNAIATGTGYTSFYEPVSPTTVMDPFKLTPTTRGPVIEAITHAVKTVVGTSDSRSHEIQRLVRDTPNVIFEATPWAGPEPGIYPRASWSGPEPGIPHMDITDTITKVYEGITHQQQRAPELMPSDITDAHQEFFSGVGFQQQYAPSLRPDITDMYREHMYGATFQRQQAPRGAPLDITDANRLHITGPEFQQQLAPTFRSFQDPELLARLERENAERRANPEQPSGDLVPGILNKATEQIAKIPNALNQAVKIGTALKYFVPPDQDRTQAERLAQKHATATAIWGGKLVYGDEFIKVQLDKMAKEGNDVRGRVNERIDNFIDSMVMKLGGPPPRPTAEGMASAEGFNFAPFIAPGGSSVITGDNALTASMGTQGDPFTYPPDMEDSPFERTAGLFGGAFTAQAGLGRLRQSILDTDHSRKLIDDAVDVTKSAVNPSATDARPLPVFDEISGTLPVVLGEEDFSYVPPVYPDAGWYDDKGVWQLNPWAAQNRGEAMSPTVLDIADYLPVALMTGAAAKVGRVTYNLGRAAGHATRRKTGLDLGTLGAAASVPATGGALIYKYATEDLSTLDPATHPLHMLDSTEITSDSIRDRLLSRISENPGPSRAADSPFARTADLGGMASLSRGGVSLEDMASLSRGGVSLEDMVSLSRGGVSLEDMASLSRGGVSLEDMVSPDYWTQTTLEELRQSTKQLDMDNFERARRHRQISDPFSEPFQARISEEFQLGLNRPARRPEIEFASGLSRPARRPGVDTSTEFALGLSRPVRQDTVEPAQPSFAMRDGVMDPTIDDWFAELDYIQQQQRDRRKALVEDLIDLRKKERHTADRYSDIIGVWSSPVAAPAEPSLAVREGTMDPTFKDWFSAGVDVIRKRTQELQLNNLEAERRLRHSSILPIETEQKPAIMSGYKVREGTMDPTIKDWFTAMDASQERQRKRRDELIGELVEYRRRDRLTSTPGSEQLNAWASVDPNFRVRDDMMGPTMLDWIREGVSAIQRNANELSLDNLEAERRLRHTASSVSEPLRAQASEEFQLGLNRPARRPDPLEGLTVPRRRPGVDPVAGLTVPLRRPDPLEGLLRPVRRPDPLEGLSRPARRPPVDADMIRNRLLANLATGRPEITSPYMRTAAVGPAPIVLKDTELAPSFTTPTDYATKSIGWLGKSVEDTRRELEGFMTELENQYSLPAGTLWGTFGIESSYGTDMRTFTEDRHVGPMQISEGYAEDAYKYMGEAPKRAANGALLVYDPSIEGLKESIRVTAAGQAQHLGWSKIESPEAVDAYLSHQLGGTGARTLHTQLAEDPNMLISDFKYAKALRSNIPEGMTAKTVGEFYEIWEDKAKIFFPEELPLATQPNQIAEQRLQGATGIITGYTQPQYMQTAAVGTAPIVAQPGRITSGYEFSQRSLTQLATIDPQLQAVARRALELSEIDFGITEGLRTLERQKELFAAGKSQTMNSRHLTGDALDVVAYVDGKVSWDPEHYYPIINAFEQASRELGVNLRSGAAWHSPLVGPSQQLVQEYKAQSTSPFLDFVHLELYEPPGGAAQMAALRRQRPSAPSVFASAPGMPGQEFYQTAGIGDVITAPVQGIANWVTEADRPARRPTPVFDEVSGSLDEFTQIPLPEFVEPSYLTHVASQQSIADIEIQNWINSAAETLKESAASFSNWIPIPSNEQFPNIPPPSILAARTPQDDIDDWGFLENLYSGAVDRISSHIDPLVEKIDHGLLMAAYPNIPPPSVHVPMRDPEQELWDTVTESVNAAKNTVQGISEGIDYALALQAFPATPPPSVRVPEEEPWFMETLYGSAADAVMPHVQPIVEKIDHTLAMMAMPTYGPPSSNFRPGAQQGPATLEQMIIDGSLTLDEAIAMGALTLEPVSSQFSNVHPSWAGNQELSAQEELLSAVEFTQSDMAFLDLSLALHRQRDEYQKRIAADLATKAELNRLDNIASDIGYGAARPPSSADTILPNTGIAAYARITHPPDLNELMWTNSMRDKAILDMLDTASAERVSLPQSISIPQLDESPLTNFVPGVGFVDPDEAIATPRINTGVAALARATNPTIIDQNRRRGSPADDPRTHWQQRLPTSAVQTEDISNQNFAGDSATHPLHVMDVNYDPRKDFASRATPGQLQLPQITSDDVRRGQYSSLYSPLISSDDARRGVFGAPRPPMTTFPNYGPPGSTVMSTAVEFAPDDYTGDTSAAHAALGLPVQPQMPSAFQNLGGYVGQGQPDEPNKFLRRGMAMAPGFIGMMGGIPGAGLLTRMVGGISHTPTVHIGPSLNAPAPLMAMTKTAGYRVGEDGGERRQERASDYTMLGEINRFAGGNQFAKLMRDGSVQQITNVAGKRSYEYFANINDYRAGKLAGMTGHESLKTTPWEETAKRKGGWLSGKSLVDQPELLASVHNTMDNWAIAEQLQGEMLSEDMQATRGAIVDGSSSVASEVQKSGTGILGALGDLGSSIANGLGSVVKAVTKPVETVTKYVNVGGSSTQYIPSPGGKGGSTDDDDDDDDDGRGGGGRQYKLSEVAGTKKSIGATGSRPRRRPSTTTTSRPKMSAGTEQRWATGGLITGPGGPTADLIPAWLSDGEYIINAAATKEFLPFLESINSNMEIPRFMDGGSVGAWNYPKPALGDYSYKGFNMPRVDLLQMSTPETVPNTIHLGQPVSSVQNDIDIKGGNTTTINMGIVGNVDSATRKTVNEMMPEIARAVSQYNSERGYR